MKPFRERLNVIPRKYRLTIFLVLALGVALFIALREYQTDADFFLKPLAKWTNTPVATFTPMPAETDTPIPLTDTPAPPTDTVMPPTPVDTPTPGAAIAPYPAAPLCASHDNSDFHTLWNDTGCHYDHEHGVSPFTSAVAAAFPGFDLFALLGSVQIGHTNPSSPMENTMKHGGFKWQVQVPAPQGCTVGFEGGTTAVDALAVQYHTFGDPGIEAEGRIHSTVALLRQCRASAPADKGYVFTNQLQDYGQRIVPYQGTLVGYPNQPVPSYDTPRGPYLSLDCIGPVAQCRSSLAQAQSNNANSIWTSKVTGAGHSDTPAFFRLLFRLRDMYRLFDWNDQVHPFTFLWLCTTDGGVEYNPAACRYNNTTTRIHEIAGNLPAPWDNLAGWDTDARMGRLTVDGFVDGSGQPAPACQAPGVECYPIKLLGAFTGFYSSEISPAKCSNTTVVCNPERDIFFNAAGQVVGETSPGAVPSGWVGPNN